MRQSCLIFTPRKYPGISALDKNRREISRAGAYTLGPPARPLQTFSAGTRANGHRRLAARRSCSPILSIGHAEWFTAPASRPRLGRVVDRQFCFPARLAVGRHSGRGVLGVFAKNRGLRSPPPESEIFCRHRCCRAAAPDFAQACPANRADSEAAICCFRKAPGVSSFHCWTGEARSPSVATLYPALGGGPKTIPAKQMSSRWWLFGRATKGLTGAAGACPVSMGRRAAALFRWPRKAQSLAKYVQPPPPLEPGAQSPSNLAGRGRGVGGKQTVAGKSRILIDRGLSAAATALPLNRPSIPLAPGHVAKSTENPRAGLDRLRRTFGWTPSRVGTNEHIPRTIGPLSQRKI